MRLVFLLLISLPGAAFLFISMRRWQQLFVALISQGETDTHHLTVHEPKYSSTSYFKSSEKVFSFSLASCSLPLVILHANIKHINLMQATAITQSHYA